MAGKTIMNYQSLFASIILCSLTLIPLTKCGKGIYTQIGKDSEEEEENVSPSYFHDCTITKSSDSFKKDYSSSLKKIVQRKNSNKLKLVFKGENHDFFFTLKTTSPIEEDYTIIEDGVFNFANESWSVISEGRASITKFSDTEAAGNYDIKLKKPGKKEITTIIGFFNGEVRTLNETHEVTVSDAPEEEYNKKYISGTKSVNYDKQAKTLAARFKGSDHQVNFKIKTNSPVTGKYKSSDIISATLSIRDKNYNNLDESLVNISFNPEDDYVKGDYRLSFNSNNNSSIKATGVFSEIATEIGEYNSFSISGSENSSINSQYYSELFSIRYDEQNNLLFSQFDGLDHDLSFVISTFPENQRGKYETLERASLRINQTDFTEPVDATININQFRKRIFISGDYAFTIEPPDRSETLQITGSFTSPLKDFSPLHNDNSNNNDNSNANSRVEMGLLIQGSDDNKINRYYPQDQIYIDQNDTADNEWAIVFNGSGYNMKVNLAESEIARLIGVHPIVEGTTIKVGESMFDVLESGTLIIYKYKLGSHIVGSIDLSIKSAAGDSIKVTSDEFMMGVPPGSESPTGIEESSFTVSGSGDTKLDKTYTPTMFSCAKDPDSSKEVGIQLAEAIDSSLFIIVKDENTPITAGTTYSGNMVKTALFEYKTDSFNAGVPGSTVTFTKVEERHIAGSFDLKMVHNTWSSQITIVGTFACNL